MERKRARNSQNCAVKWKSAEESPTLGNAFTFFISTDLNNFLGSLGQNIPQDLLEHEKMEDNPPKN